MNLTKVLIAGGAGFVGSNLAGCLMEAASDAEVWALDNLRRPGSSLNLPFLRSHGVRFIHGDVRCPDDLADLPDFDLLIDCAAEASVHLGPSESPARLLDQNLQGTIHLLDAARKRDAAFMLLSTSRVYPIQKINGIEFREEPTRYSWNLPTKVPGISEKGIGESFPLDGVRSFYGASKLASELILQEYVGMFGMKAIINRCGLLAGPRQMAKASQGLVTWWVARHFYQKTLSFTGFGGAGKQVRDVLHIDDFGDLVLRQIEHLEAWQGDVYNVGGGAANSLSLVELTQLCQAVTGNRLQIGCVPDTNPFDLRIFISYAEKARREFAWIPKRSVDQTVKDIHDWIARNRAALEPLFA